MKASQPGPDEWSWKTDGAASLGILGVTLIAYLSTCCRTVSPVGDSGELTTAAVTLGIPHPPGYPMFVLLGHVASLFPTGDMGARVNLLATLAGALAIVLSFWAIRQAGLNRWAAATGALALAFSTTTWQMSASAEMRTLYLAMAASLLGLLFRFWRQPSHSTLVWMAFLTGLGMTVHYNVVLVAVVIFVAAISSKEGQTSWAPLWHLLVALVAGLLPLLYLPWRSQADPYLNWGNPSNLTRLAWVLTRNGYGGVSAAAHGPESGAPLALQGLAHATWSEFTPVFAVLAGLGLWAGWRRERRIGALLLCAAAVLGPGFVIGLQPLPDPDIWINLGRQFLAFWLIYACCVAEGSAWLQRLVPKFPVGIATLLLVCLPAMSHFSGADLHGESLGFLYGRDLLSHLAPNTVLLLKTDPAVSTATYQQGVLGLRPDVVIVPTGHLGSPWFQAELERRHPDLFKGFDWTNGSPDVLVEWLLKKGPVYVDAPWGSIDDRLMEQGIVYRIAKDPNDLAQHDPDPYVRALDAQVLDFVGQETPRSLAEPNGAYIHFIVSQYSLAYTNLAVAMGRRGWDAKAAKALDAALQLDPHSAVAHFNRGFLFESHEDYQRAVVEYQQAIQDDPTYGAAYLALSAVYRHNGQTADADAATAEAKKYVPSSPSPAAP